MLRKLQRLLYCLIPRPRRFYFFGLTACLILVAVLVWLASFKPIVIPKYADVDWTVASDPPPRVFRPEYLCSELGDSMMAVIFVHTAPHHVIHRHVIRYTWGSQQVSRQLRIGTVFVIGRVNDTSLRKLIQWEAEMYGDVVQVPFPDSHRMLTYKALAGMNWVLTNCRNARFAIKADDDVFINVFSLARFLRERQQSSESLDKLICLAWHGMPIVRDPTSRWNVGYYHRFNSSVYPVYCSGTAFIVPMEVLAILHNASLFVPFFWVDDVYVTGLLAQEANIGHEQIGHRYLFGSRSMEDIVSGKLLFIHADGDDGHAQRTRLWQQLMTYEKKQKDEKEKVVSDIYDDSK